MQISHQTPDFARSADSYSFGVYRRAIANPNVCASGCLAPLRLKEWHYVSVSTPRHFFACAIVRLGYAAKMFAYLVDREHPDRTVEASTLHPLSLGVRFASSSIAGRTVWHKGNRSLQIEYVQNPTPGWNLDVNLELGSVVLQGQLHIEDAEALALLYKLPTGNPAYTHKAAGLFLRGKLTANGQPIELTDAMAGIDWTRSVALRQTRWLWSALQGVTPQRQRVGLNLSALVYDDENGNSQENALWVDGKVYPLGGVQFVLPKDPRKQPWRIHSRSGGTKEVDLLFTPLGTREEHVHLGLIKSDFIQPYGTYQGTVCPTDSGIPSLSVGGLFGVVETHESVW